MLQQVVKELTNKELNEKEISNFWKSGRNFDKFLKRWGIINIKEFWDTFDQRDYQERVKMIDQGTCFLYPDTLKILENLKRYKNIKMGIISNTPAKIAQMELKKLNLSENFFDILLFLGTQQQKIAKPNPKSIELALKKIKINKKNTFFIGDTELDILAGKNAKINTIFILREHNTKHELSVKPDYVIENLTEICNILKIYNAEGGI
ncbi:MAG: HAD family hydrolase [Candidatus Lokiarchaeota archaeon]|nr:HAD family hydrolase [Candidatus Lokiarchaeota archaeon]